MYSLVVLHPAWGEGVLQMALKTARPIATITKRGSGLVIPITDAWAKVLGWNRNDQVHLAVVRGALLVTRIVLPKVGDLQDKVKRSG